jgi:hypothetical protein
VLMSMQAAPAMALILSLKKCVAAPTQETPHHVFPSQGLVGTKY